MQLIVIYDNGEVYAIDAIEIYDPFPEEMDDVAPSGERKPLGTK